MTEAIDLSEIETAIRAQDEGVEVDILGLDGKTPLGFKIRVAGPDSARAVAAQEASTNDLLAQEDAGRPNASAINQRAIIHLAKVTMGWEPAIKIDGEALAYSEANAITLYTRFRFIREQVDRAAGKRARFTKG